MSGDHRPSYEELAVLVAVQAERIGQLEAQVARGNVRLPRSSGIRGLISGFICSTVCPRQPVDLVGDVAPEVGREVLVAGGHGVGGPAHEAHHGALADPQDEQHGRGGVSGVVESCFSHVRFGE